MDNLNFKLKLAKKPQIAAFNFENFLVNDVYAVFLNPKIKLN